MRVIERRALVRSIAVFVLALAVGAAVVAHFYRLEVDRRRAAASDLAGASAFAIEQRFSFALASAETMAGLVANGASERELNGVAERLIALAGGAISLQLARDCVISHVWPWKGNEAAFGLDLLASARHGPFTRHVIEKRAPLVYGPFELIQGGSGLALRVPVYVREGGREQFWGLASAILRVPVLLAESRVDRLVEAGLEYTIVRASGDGVAGELLATSRPGARPPADVESVPVVLPGQTWTLGVVPARGWGGFLVPGILPLGVLLVALLAAGLAYRVVALPEVLRREVAARTRDLEQAHAEQRRAQEAQRQSQKLESIGLLAGGIAHDFNNLLVGILGYADVLAAEAAPGSVTEEAARTITQAAQRAAELIRQLLAIARMGRHREEQVDLHALAREVVSLFGRTLDKAIRLETRLEASHHEIRGDSGQLQQVVLNLGVNARDAMPDGGTLTVGTATVDLDGASAPQGIAPGRYVTLWVADTGVGIPEEHRSRIFEPFFTTKSEGKGSGLGLATAFGIVKGHGGTIQVYSEVGVGSRFVVYLPVVDERPVDAAPAKPPPRGAGTILVVDDEELVRRTAARVLASLGYEPVAVSGGEEALRWLAAQPSPPAVVLLDLSMPGMDGPECFRQLRALHPGLRVVVTSGFSSSGRGEALLAEGAVGFVQKPYSTAELATTLARAQRADPA
jgi:signal transduction histidine kinase/ActR/RegA family two-component response regulator